MIGYKGELVLYSLDYKVLVSGHYNSKAERKLLMRNWLERHQSMAYYFEIKPLDEIVKMKRDWYREKEKQMMAEEVPEVMIRPPSVYSNKASPFGIADHLHKNIKNK